MDGIERESSQDTAVVQGLNLHALGQDICVQLIDLCMDTFEDFVGVFTATKEDDALDDLAFIIETYGTLAGRVGLNHTGDVTYSHRSAGIDLEYDVFNVL